MSRSVLVLMNDLGDNDLVRAYSLWLLAEQLGWSLDVHGPCSGPLWPPAAGTPFAQRCHPGPPTAERARSVDAIVAVKPTRTTLGTALDMRGSDTGIVLDIDEPMLEPLVPLQARSLPDRVRGVVTGRYHPVEAARVRLRARRVPRTVSNPALQRDAGDRVVPHVRTPRPAGAPHVDGPLSVGFVGTARAFKGVESLRSSTRRVPEASLTITDRRPSDAADNEQWLGSMSMSRAQEVLDALDVAVIPSDRTSLTEGQLPMKLIDAMLSGRAVVASDLPPIRWALGDAGVLVSPGDTEELTAALDRLRNATVRAHLGSRARRRALAMFTPAAAAPGWASVIAAAAGGSRT